MLLLSSSDHSPYLGRFACKVTEELSSLISQLLIKKLSTLNSQLSTFNKKTLNSQLSTLNF